MVSVLEGAKIVGNKLIVEYEEGGWGTETFVPKEKDEVVNVKNQIIEFILPENYNQNTNFVSEFTVYYREIDKVNYLIDVDAYYENDELMQLDEKTLGYPVTWANKIDFMSDSEVNELLIGEWQNDDFEYTFNKDNSLIILEKCNNEIFRGIFKLKDGRIDYKYGENLEIFIKGFIIHISKKVFSFKYPSNNVFETKALFNLNT